MKKVFIVLGVIVAVIVVLVAGRNFFVKAAVESGVKALTGLSLEMAKLDIGLFNTTLQIKGLKLYNPAGYPDRLMVDLPEVYVDYSLRAFLKGRVYLPEVRLNLKEFMVVKNAKGELNLNSLAVMQQQKEGKAPAASEGEKKPAAPMPEMRVDLLRLDIGTVVYKDYSGGRSEPKVQTFEVNIHQTYKDITNPQAFVSLIMVKALANTTIAGLGNFDFKGLKENAGSALKNVAETVSQSAGQAAVQITGTLADTMGKFLPGDKN